MYETLYIYYINWCRISSINSTDHPSQFCFLIFLQTQQPRTSMRPHELPHNQPITLAQPPNPLKGTDISIGCKKYDALRLAAMKL